MQTKSRQAERMILASRMAAGLIILAMISACIDDVPPCPGQCFAYTLERSLPSPCRDDGGVEYLIVFTASDPNGYRGRSCFNSTSVLLVAEAIDHLDAGGQLSDLDPGTQAAYLSTVNTVRADLEAACIAAAPGQCTNAAEVCSVIGSDMYAALVIDETCVLERDGTAPVKLGPGQLCEPLAADDDTGSADSGAHCIEITPGDGMADDTATGGADETTG